MRIINKYVSYILLIILFSACRKLPEKRDYLSQNASFNKEDVYEPVLGRTTMVKTQFSGDGSTYPMLFSIENARHASDGSPAPELFEKIKVQEWKRNYTGKETSLAQIDSERIWVEKPFFEIRPGSGDFIFRSASSQMIHAYPDSGYLFDVKVQNKGNERVFKDFYLRPLKEVPYEPYEYDIHTGDRKTETRTTKDGKSYYVPYTIHPASITNMYFTRDSLFKDTLISVSFYKNTDKGGNGHSLTFKFLDEDFNPIDPAKFNNTKWEMLVHGFDMAKTATQVTYQVAYPVPLTELTTPYASDGKAHVRFGYSRKGFGGSRIDAYFTLDFSIYEPGDWTILFYFRRNPLFEDD